MWRRCAAAFVPLALFVSGCASGEPPSAAVPPSASASASGSPAGRVSASPSPSPTASPVAVASPFVSAGDEAGAYAFVKAYFAAVDRAIVSGNTDPLVPYRLPSCSCLGVEREIRSLYVDGVRLGGARLSILKWVYGDHGPAFARTAIHFHSTAITRISPKGRTTEPAIDGDYFVDLRRTGGRWIISDIRFKQTASG